MIDCHCHLADKEFSSDIAEVVKRATEAGVIATLVCSEFEDQFNQVIDLSKKYENFCFPCIGIHPIQRRNTSVELKHIVSVPHFVEEYAGDIASIGEVGLDFCKRYRLTEEQKLVQVQVLERQIELAKQFDLPLNIHSRDAHRATLDVLINSGASRVLLHAFGGDPAITQIGVNAGYYFSIPPSFARGDNAKKFVEQIPLSQLCLETDSPVLGFDKSKRNEPANITISAKFISDVKGISVEEVITTTTKNAVKLFPILNRVIR